MSYLKSTDSLFWGPDLYSTGECQYEILSMIYIFDPYIYLTYMQVRRILLQKQLLKLELKYILSHSWIIYDLETFPPAWQPMNCQLVILPVTSNNFGLTRAIVQHVHNVVWSYLRTTCMYIPYIYLCLLSGLFAIHAVYCCLPRIWYSSYMYCM